MAEDKKTPDANLPSVEDILRAQGDAPPTSGSAKSEAGGSLGMAPQSEDEEIIDFDPEMVDKALTEEDPAFAAQLKEIQATEFKTDVAIEAVDIEAFLKEGEAAKAKQVAVKKMSFKERARWTYGRWHAGISKLIDDVQNGGLSLAKNSVLFLFSSLKKSLKFLINVLKKFFSWALHIPKKTKLLALSVLILGAAAAFSMYVSFRSHFLPSMQSHYLTGLAEHASEAFEYKDTDSKESFESAIRHPEHMYELEKIVVNLKGRPNADRLPMGLFEFYIELNSQEATIEFGDRKTEARHIIERILEQLSYEELVTPQGKNKMKFIIRKELNDFLSKSHRVRQIYIKTIVLKP